MLGHALHRSSRSPEWVIFWPMLALPFPFVATIHLLAFLGIHPPQGALVCMMGGALALLYCGRIIYYSPILPWRKWAFFAILSLIITAQLGILLALPTHG